MLCPVSRRGVAGLDRREEREIGSRGREGTRGAPADGSICNSSSVLFASSGAEVAEGGGELNGLPAVRDRVYVAVEFDVQGLYSN
jgi:hypothetical protein